MQDLVSKIYVQSRSVFISAAIVIKMKIIINLWRLQHERATFNTNYLEYPALLVGGGRKSK